MWLHRWIWWFTPLIPALRRYRKENHEFETSLGSHSQIISQDVCICSAQTYLKNSKGEDNMDKKIHLLLF
jgi:hypothetical protein